MTVDTPPLLTEADARRLTLRIGLLLDSAAGVLDNLSAAIREARDRRADLALGYGSWAEYATAEFGDRTAGLAPAIRRELVASLSVEVDGSPALSTRQIAPAVGVSHMAVQRDREAGVSERYTCDGEVYQADTPAPSVVPTGALLSTPPFDPATGEALDEPAPVRTVGGLDGKTYTFPARPEAKPRRKSLPDRLKDKADEVFQAALDLHGAIEDDRFAANRESISFLTFNRSRAAAVALTDFIAALDPNAAVETEEARDRLAADLNHISETFARLARSLTEEPK